MRRLLHFYLSILLMMILFCGYGQTNKILIFPKEFLKSGPINLNPFDFFSRPDDVQEYKIPEDTPWVVYSDRKDNPIFARNTDKLPSDNLNFLEKCVVLKGSFNYLNGCRLFVIRQKHLVTRNNLFFAPIQLAFWIDWDKLILSPHCLRLNSYGINRKVLTLYKFNKCNDNRPFEYWGQELNYYSNPKNDTSKYVLYPEDSYQMRFIYKFSTDSNFLLVGREPIDSSMIENNFNTSVIGWLHRTHVINWDHRMAWELNWDDSAVKERTWDRIKICPNILDGNSNINDDTAGCILFRNKGMISRYYEQGIENICNWRIAQNDIHNIEGNNLYKTREPGIQSRFPVLDLAYPNSCHEDPDHRKLGIVRVINPNSYKQGFQDYKQNDFNKLQSRVHNINENSRIINIVFIIDATKSIIKYDTSISSAISESMDKIINERKDIYNKIFNFSAVLFRDFEETDNVVQVYPSLTTDFDSLGLWIKKRMTPEYYGEDSDFPEAMYYGIKTAFDSIINIGDEINDKQSNYFIIIGDAGDHQNDLTKGNTYINENTILELITEYNFNIIACQVRRPDTTWIEGRSQRKTKRINKDFIACESFERQMKDIIEKTTCAIKERILCDTTFFDQPIIDSIRKLPCKLSVMNSSGQYVYSLPSWAPLYSKLKISPPGDSLHPDSLQSFISDNIYEINLHVNKLLREVLEVSNDSLNPGSEYTGKVVYKLLSSDISLSQFQIMLSKKRYLYEEVYGIYKNKKSDFPNFQQVLFIEDYDLDDIIEAIKLIIDEEKSDDERKVGFIDFFKYVVKGFIGYENHDCNTIPLCRLFSCFLGNNYCDNYDGIYNYSIDGIDNLNINELNKDNLMGQNTISYFQIVLDNLKFIRGNVAYKGLLKAPTVNNNYLFYWVPIKVFLHN